MPKDQIVARHLGLEPKMRHQGGILKGFKGCLGRGFRLPAEALCEGWEPKWDTLRHYLGYVKSVFFED